MDDRAGAIAKARGALNGRHAAMATVNDDGSPHNTPFMWLHDDHLTRILWGSHPSSVHSRNILRTGQLFVVVYDANKFGGIYLQAESGHIVEGDELVEALSIHNTYRAREGKEFLNKEYYEGNSPQRMWSANITGLWVNSVRRDEQGHVLKDFRYKVTAEELTN